MSGKQGILNADMATIAAWARKGFAWWREELAEMIPARWRQGGRRQGAQALFRPGKPLGLQRGYGVEDLPMASRPRPMDLAIPTALSLQREINVPVMSRSDLDSYVALEADRLLPLGRDSLLVDSMIVERGTDGRMTVRIAALDRTTADEALDAARLAGVIPARLGIAGGADETGFDFAPALRAEGKLPAAFAGRQFWWALVAFALLVNIALLIWRDQQQVANLQAVVDGQQPALAVYRTMAGRARRAGDLAANSVERRRHHMALTDLAAATTALPLEAWVQRYAWDGRTLRLSGYSRPAVDVVAALRRQPRFANVRPTNGDVPAEISAGQPFDVMMDIRGGGR